MPDFVMKILKSNSELGSLTLFPAGGGALRPAQNLNVNNFYRLSNYLASKTVRFCIFWQQIKTPDLAIKMLKSPEFF